MVRQNRNVIQEFLRNFTSIATIMAYKRDIEDFFGYYNGTFTKPEDVTLDHLIRYRDSLTARGLSSSSVNRKLSSIKSLFNWFVNESFVATNPASGLRLPKNNVEAPTLAFTDEEVRRMIIEPDMTTFHGNVHTLILAFLFHLGLRRSELVNLQRGDLIEDRSGLVLRIKGKGGKHRFLPVSSELDQYIRTYFGRVRDWEDHDYLIQSSPFEKNTKPMNPNTVFKIVRRYAKAVGVDRRVGPHSCRATVISHLLENEVSPRDVANFAGHSNIHTTVGIYDKKRDGIKNSAALKVDYACSQKSD